MIPKYKKYLKRLKNLTNKLSISIFFYTKGAAVKYLSDSISLVQEILFEMANDIDHSFHDLFLQKAKDIEVEVGLVLKDLGSPAKDTVNLARMLSLLKRFQRFIDNVIWDVEVDNQPFTVGVLNRISLLSPKIQTDEQRRVMFR